jgi:DNA-directed RNA polymerase beta' subunit
MLIANTDNQYLVPTSGKPLRGLIQDHVVAGVWMTCQDAFFSREEYFQLLYGALRPEQDSHCSGRLLTLPPTIWKPKPLWTGKQIVGTNSRVDVKDYSRDITDLYGTKKYHP